MAKWHRREDYLKIVGERKRTKPKRKRKGVETEAKTFRIPKGDRSKMYEVRTR